MTPENQDDEPLFARVATTAQRRRRGVNYPVVLVALGVFVLAGFATFMWLRPGGGAGVPELGTPSLQEARACLSERDTACAEADYRAYLKKYPQDVSATGLLAILLTQDGQHKEAIGYYKRGQALGAATYDFDANYALSLDNTGDLNGAIKMNYAALQIVPNLVDVRGALAGQLVRAGRPQEALDLLQQFDETLQDEGHGPYFQAQIDQIKAKMGVAAPVQTAAAVVPVAGRVEIPLQADHGALFVPVVVDDSLTLKFVVDSGASDVSIPADVAQTLTRMGKLSSADHLGRGVFTMANGAQAPGELVRLRSMRVGGQQLADVSALVTNTRGELLLGQSFLRHFKSWSIDNRRRVLVLEN